ncbi:MAG: nucleoside hydrolase [Janthinobacterium lividum]
MALVVDCDPGTDDAVALLLCAGSPELGLAAVTVSGGNVGLRDTVRNACAVLGLAGCGVAVHPGADRPLRGRFMSETRVHGEAGLGGVVLPDGPAPSSEAAVDALRRILREAEGPVTLAGIAPATNLALALASEPGLAAKVARVVLMAGAAGEGNVTASAEFNAWSDPEALAIVLGSGCEVVLAPLELTAQALVTPARVAALRAVGGGRCLQAACDILASVPPSPRLGGVALHDPCTIAWLAAPSLFATVPARVEVLLDGVARGRTVVERRGRTGAANAVLLDRLDADGFFALLAERLARLP